ncbi:MAG: FtsW/RodA/SpoVE family cell cycle protein [Prevotella sp.]|jgi:cell division protein FtsW (lipid II flippase)/cell division protein FtsI/penicillin-binding protein 2|nr:FtsW/RodA/SpoVE family cell cycle protein [Prevotella sp.]
MRNDKAYPNVSGGSVERKTLALVTVVLCLGFFTLFSNFKEQLLTAETGYSAQTTLCLNRDVNVDALSGLLVRGNYIFDAKDAAYIARHLKNILQKYDELPNLGEINKSAFLMSAADAYKQGGDGLRHRVDSSYATLGVTGEALAKYSTPIPSTIDLDGGNSQITVRVQEADTSASWFARKILRRSTKPAASVLVRLKQHYYLAYYDKATADSLTIAADSVLGYAMTDRNGTATFWGLDGTGYYSVLPVRKGYEYGASKGTADGNLDASENEFIFRQNEHKITPFDMQTYRQIKEDNVLTARTPARFRNSFITSLIFFFMAWWSISIVLRISRKKTANKEADPLLLPVLMTLSGVGLLAMYAITNPLTDKLLGYDTAIGAIVGVVLFGLVSRIDFSAFFSVHSPFLLQSDFVMRFLEWAARPFYEKLQTKKSLSESLAAYRLKLLSKIACAVLCFPLELILRPLKSFFRPFFKTEGAGYLMLAFLLLVLLYLFGSGPEGSGVKVNLFFFQPSEITKYLVVIFLAVFFKNNAGKIRKFSEEFDWMHIKAQLRTVAIAILGIGALLLCYLVLGDMGPALVLAVTFIIIYSVVRGDFGQLLLGVLSFAVFLGGAYCLLDKSQSTLLAFAALWLFVWVGYGLLKPRKQLYESAIFMNMVIAAFLFGGLLFGQLGLSHQAQRLQDRIDICLSGIWDNEVRGGDQVVQGLWSLASGGWVGQGLGEGNPNLTPAFHTDMIFASIGEEMGWLGLLLIVLCMFLLLHRSLQIGYQAGNPLLFYLAAGIAVVTGIQFLVITLGSAGLIPLTGVAVPFLSYGKTSLIINLAFFGVLYSISKRKATETQAKSIEPYRKIVGVSSIAYAAVSTVLLACLLFGCQVFKRDKTLLRPAFVCNRQGERVAEYNPRIRLLIKQIDAGNIYDRNGLLLAASDKSAILNNIDRYREAGIAESAFRKEMQQHKQRYYPFGDNLFFWTGDYNTSILWNDSEDNPRGYIAERRHLAALRGFDNLKDETGGIVGTATLKAQNYKASPFLHPVKKEYSYICYNYSALLPMLKDGLNGSKVKAWNDARKNRDITLTVDAALQTRMQNEISAYIACPEQYGLYKDYFKGEIWNRLRVSVVVMNAATGDLLCSANYPLPIQDSLRVKPDYIEKNMNGKAATDRDLGLTFQTAPGSTAKVMSAMSALKKMGVEAADKKYFIYPDEIIERGKVNEPNNRYVSMEDAIVLSSNCYFINLVNDNNLYASLNAIYSAAGVRIDKKLTGLPRGAFKPMTPYYFDYKPPMPEYKSEIASTGNKAVHLYNDYITKRDSGSIRVFERMSGYAHGHDWNDAAWAWGQGSMRATPLNMARIAAIVANGGKFVPTQFVLKSNRDKTVKRPKYRPIQILPRPEADILKTYMLKEADKHRNNPVAPVAFPTDLNMGGKTGTPERGFSYEYIDEAGKTAVKTMEMNDGWYIFFIDSPKENAPLAVAVRMERLRDKNSKAAVFLTDKVVLKALGEYIQTNAIE